MSKNKVTNIKEKDKLNNYTFRNPITNEVETLNRDLVRVRLAQWQFYMVSERKRLDETYLKIQELINNIDNIRKEIDNGK